MYVLRLPTQIHYYAATFNRKFHGSITSGANAPTAHMVPLPMLLYTWLLIKNSTLEVGSSRHRHSWNHIATCVMMYSYNKIHPLGMASFFILYCTSIWIDGIIDVNRLVQWKPDSRFALVIRMKSPIAIKLHIPASSSILV